MRISDREAFNSGWWKMPWECFISKASSTVNNFFSSYHHEKSASLESDPFASSMRLRPRPTRHHKLRYYRSLYHVTTSVCRPSPIPLPPWRLLQWFVWLDVIDVNRRKIENFTVVWLGFRALDSTLNIHKLFAGMTGVIVAPFFGEWSRHDALIAWNLSDVGRRALNKIFHNENRLNSFGESRIVSTANPNLDPTRWEIIRKLVQRYQWFRAEMKMSNFVERLPKNFASEPIFTARHALNTLLIPMGRRSCGGRCRRTPSSRRDRRDEAFHACPLMF